MPQFIYALTDPVTDEVRYVGITDNAHTRYMQHCNDTRDNHSDKAVWIKSLKDRLLLPGLKILEIAEFDVLQREKYWIKYYADQGANLTNIIIPRHPVHPVNAIRTSDKVRLKEALLSAHRSKIEGSGKYSLYRLSRDINVDYGYIHRVFHGKSLPSRKILLMICKALGCSLEKMDEIFEFALYSSPTREEFEQPSVA
jgi:hypothetical protein